MSHVVTRFAPSPTGYLHIGSARTALFNWLFARHHSGKYLLRIEDTDRERSKPEAIQLIFETLEWLGLDHDEDVVYQFARASRHAEVAKELVKNGKAYYCYCTQQELEQMREEAKAKGLPPKYNGFWRDRDPHLAPKDVKPVIRLKAPQEGHVTIHDKVQGAVTVENSQLDDMVLLRGDGTPTYMLSVVVDDHDMGITHIIRGDDHLTNAFRQYQLYKAMDWNVPIFAHIPLIHGHDGAKLSKRHGALGAEAYRDMGFLPEAMRNYLMRLGWGHGNEEIIPTKKAIELFDLDGVGRSPSRFDVAKLTNLNGHYIREMDNVSLYEETLPFLKQCIDIIDEDSKARILKGMDALKQRSKTLPELAEMMLPYIKAQELDEKAKACITEDFLDLAQRLIGTINDLKDPISHTVIEEIFRAKAVEWNKKLGELAQVIRIALSGRTVSPSVFEMIEIIGKEETLNRLRMLKK